MLAELKGALVLVGSDRCIPGIRGNPVRIECLLEQRAVEHRGRDPSPIRQSAITDSKMWMHLAPCAASSSFERNEPCAAGLHRTGGHLIEQILGGLDAQPVDTPIPHERFSDPYSMAAVRIHWDQRVNVAPDGLRIETCAQTTPRSLNQRDTPAGPSPWALRDMAMDVELVGSTAIPRMPGKGIIDILITVASLEPQEAYDAPPTGLGYTECPVDRPDRFYTKPINTKSRATAYTPTAECTPKRIGPNEVHTPARWTTPSNKDICSRASSHGIQHACSGNRAHRSDAESSS